MTRLSRFLSIILAGAILSLTALAHSRSGSIRGRVVDEQEKSVRGAVVSISGNGEHRRILTDSTGEFQVESIPPGHYVIKAAAVGFRNAVLYVEVPAGSVAAPSISLSPGLEESITVMGEKPLFDVRRSVTGIVVDQSILQQFPSTRDPWAVLQAVPGVLVDRVNVAGNESAEQAFQVSNGVGTDQSTFAIDGIPITDMIDTGTLPTFFDFESFDQIRVVTGGSDPRVSTPGVQMDLITRRGTDELRGSGRLFWTDDSLQSDARVPAEASSYLGTASSIRRIEEYGIEMGGALMRERLWGWGALSRRTIDLTPAAVHDVTGIHTNTFDQSTFENVDLKLNALIGSRDSTSLMYAWGDHLRLGQGVNVFRPRETAWDEVTRSELLSLKHTRIFSPTSFATASFLDADFSSTLEPVGGRDVDVLIEPDGVFHGSFLHYDTERPQRYGGLDASWFQRTGAWEHEVRFGVGHRQTSTRESIGWPGSGNLVQLDFGDHGTAILTRSAVAGLRSVYDSAYIGDTILWRNFVIQAGGRVDRQRGRNLASAVPANPVFPELLPAAAFAGDETNLEWNNVSPRLGLTWAARTARRFLVRVSYADYRDQLSGLSVLLANPFYDIQYLTYRWTDFNRDRQIQGNELLFLESATNINVNDPGGTVSYRRFDSDLEAPRTQELLLGLETEIGRGTFIGLNLIHRTREGLLWVRGEKTWLAGDFYTQDDYRLVSTVTGRLPDGNSYAVPMYGLAPGVPLPEGYVVQNRPGYSQTFEGIDLVATRQFDERWMLRTVISWSDWKQHVSPEGVIDPSMVLDQFGCSGCDGAAVVQGPDFRVPTRQAIYINAGWSYTFNVLYRLPFGFTAAATMYGREGYPIPYYRTVYAGDGQGRKNLLVSEIGRDRLDDVFELDVRLSKELRLRGTSLSLMLDVFNLTDERVVLQRSNRLNNLVIHPNPANNRILEVQSPRVFRLGASFSF